MPQVMFYLVKAGFEPAMGITRERGRFVTLQDSRKRLSGNRHRRAFVHIYLRLMANQLFGFGAQDPLTLAVVAIVSTLVALVAATAQLDVQCGLIRWWL